jgi:hypothetical protein
MASELKIPLCAKALSKKKEPLDKLSALRSEDISFLSPGLHIEAP